MALEHLSYAYECEVELSTVAALMLYVIAHQIGKNECCWPSYEYLGQKIHKSARTAFTACQELVNKGLLYIDSGKERGGSNCFYMLIPEKYHRDFVRKYKAYPKTIDQHWEENRALVDKSRLVNRVGSPLHTPVGSPLQTEVGNPAAKVGKIPQEGMKPASDNQQDRTEKIEEQDMFPALAPVRELPPRQNAYLPPIDSAPFRNMVTKICNELGAPEAITLRIYEHNRLMNWAVLRKKTLLLALTNAVWYWMKFEPRQFRSEQIRDFIRKHPELATDAPDTPDFPKPEIS